MKEREKKKCEKNISKMYSEKEKSGKEKKSKMYSEKKGLKIVTDPGNYRKGTIIKTVNVEIDK